MKFNLNIVKRFALKNKFVLLSLFIIAIFFIYFMKPIREGLTGSAIGEYQYLAPPPSGNTWSQTTLSQFVAKFNAVNNLVGTDNEQFVSTLNGQIWQNALEEEAQYYIQNGKWPYDSYMTNYVSQNPNLFVEANSPYGNINASNVMQIYSNRYCYGNFIYQLESKQTPQPLSCQIYLGTVPPPTPTSSSPKLPSPPSLSLSSSSSSPSSQNSLSGANYQQFVSLCKSVVGNN